MRILPTICLLLLLLAPWCPAEDDEPPVWNGRASREIKAVINEYFGAGAERREEIRAILDTLGTLRDKDVKTWTKNIIKAWRKSGDPLERKSGTTFTHGDLTGPVYMAGRPKRRGALFVGLHGGGEGAGDGKTALQKWSLAAGDAWVIAPTAPELRASAWCAPDIEQWVLALIAAAIRTYDLDPNRIYMAGHSMGGYGTWSIGCRHADRFASLGPCAGGIFVIRGGSEVRVAPGHIPNLLNTPIRFFNSTDDPRVSPLSSQAADRELKRLKEAGYPYVWVYDEYDDIGHGVPAKGVKPIVDWMVEHKRDPYPKHVVWEPSRQLKRRFFWLGLISDTWIEGKIDGNAIALTTKRPPGIVTLYLNGHLVDVAKPVTVTLNEKPVFEGVIPARLSTMLDCIAVRGDPGQIYDRLIEVP